MKKRNFRFILILLAIFLIAGCGTKKNAEKDNEAKEKNKISDPIPVDYQGVETKQIRKPAKGDSIATIDTSMGKIQILLFEKECPKAVENFIQLAKEKYFEELNFSSYTSVSIGIGKIGDKDYEVKTASNKNFDVEIDPDFGMLYGSLIIPRRINVSGEKGMNTGQFAIIDKNFLADEEKQELEGMDINESLKDAFLKIGGNVRNQGKITVFGQVIKGMDTIEKMRAVELDSFGGPKKIITINNVTVNKVE
ncbi:peptidylprolyl isomerase [Clostridium sp. MSJ-4]|uniref:peptidylprolyl isomerase n=1 Tax=Clostridium simiarum TaxID=2841506 RepID=A0ABS6EZB9_9CLOT|nr:peptidylprolyl isomerase [Clostridium simiarum]MBU5590707.1 peptidylprolyl isomerase [Clostridium simiarum]